MREKIKQWHTQNKGWYNAVKIINSPDATVLQFEYDATTKKGVETQFCELGELTYVTESYFRSAIKLLSDIVKRIEDLLRDNSGECEIPDDLIKEIARCLVPDIIAFFETEEAKREFEAWKLAQEKNAKNKDSK